MRALTVQTGLVSLSLGLTVAALSVPAAAAEPTPTEVTNLVIDTEAWTVPSRENTGPVFYAEASDPEGLVSMVGHWCHEELTDYCISPTWTAESPGVPGWDGTGIMADVPSDAPLGTYVFQDLTFTDSVGHTTTMLPGGGVLVDGAAASQSHPFNLVGVLDVRDETVPVLHDLRWADGRDWAVVGGEDAVAMDLHVSDDWREAVHISVQLAGEAGRGGVMLQGTLPARESGTQDDWVRATGTLGSTMTESATYSITQIVVVDAAGNRSDYYPDGTGSEDTIVGTPVATRHQLDLSGVTLDVRDAVPSFRDVTPIADSTIRFSWTPAKDADGSAPGQYTLHLVPFALSGDPSNRDPWSPGYWQPGSLPEQVVTVPGDQTEVVVDGLDNGRRYDAQVVANFWDRDVADQPAWAIPWPSISYSPSVAVVEGDEGLTDAVVTARLSGPSLIDVRQSASLLPITATEGDDYRGYAGSLTVPAGSTSATMKVRIVGDVRDEEDETLEVHRHDLYGGIMDAQSTTITVIDDDPSPGAPLAIGSTTVPGVGPGTAPAVLTVRLARAHRRTVTVEYRTRDGSAVAGTDYAARRGTLRFRPGTLTRRIAIPVYGDSGAGETALSVRLRNARGARVSRALGKVRISRS